MIKFQKHISFFDFLQKYFPSDNTPNDVKKTNSEKNIEKVEKMLSDLKIEQPRISNPFKTVLPISQQFSNLDSTPSHDSTDSYCNKSKICNVLTKFEEQENLLITLISKFENPE